jgi:serine/threonine-protein kinase RsbW
MASPNKGFDTGTTSPSRVFNVRIAATRPSHFLGEQQWKIGPDYAYSPYSGRKLYRPVEIDAASGTAIEGLHIRMRGRSQREATMFEKMKVARIHSFGGPESSTSASQSFHSAPFVEVRNTVPSHVDIISPFIDQLMRFISRFRGADGNNFEIELALHEALVNAIVHGNQEDLHKRVYVKCRCMTDREVPITIENEGHGFRSDMVPDPTSPDNRLRTHGRGIYLMRTLMDEVDFEQGGSVVRMRTRAKAGSDTPRKAQ